MSVEQQLHRFLEFDRQQEVERTCGRIRDLLRQRVGRRGLVVAMSGGIDSSVCAALSVEALGARRVFGLLLPERDSSSFSLERGGTLAEHLGIPHEVQDIAPTLAAIGCYRWRDEAIRATVPEYKDDWKSKIVIRGGMEGQYNHFELVVESPSGEMSTHRLGLHEYLTIVAATNFKQRVRKNIEYFHADRLNYAVVGTPNRLEYDQGFFVKNGDGAADIKPIAHLYKSQVYALAHHLGLPDSVCAATPTTDTYSLPQGQDEFYFALPYQQMDVALWAHNNGVSAEELAGELDIEPRQAERIYSDIEAKRRTTGYLHDKALLVSEVPEIGH